MNTLKVTINGVDTPCLEAHTLHDVDAPIATGSLVMLAPRPSHVDLGNPVRIEMGYDPAIRTVFYGKVADDDATFSESGGMLRVAIEGWGKYLWYAQQADLTFLGMTSYKEIFRSLCARQKVPLSYADNATYPNGDTLNFGGLGRVNNGNVTIPKDSSPGEVLDRLGRLFGYRVYDRPDGYVRMKKISGLPVGDVFRAYEQGVNVLDVRQTRTLDGMVNYWEVIGARYTNPDGSETALRSIPATVPFDARLGPSGVNRDSKTDADLVNLPRCDYCRNVQEIDRSTPYYRWTWTGMGDAEMSPGQVVSVTSPMVGTNTRLWLMSVAHTFTDDEWTTAMSGWAGAGTALPAGNDCATQTLVGNGGFHLGNEYLAHYRRRNPDGTTKTIPFSVTNGYSTLTIRGYAHGCNSFARNTDSTASRFEIWQGGAKVAEGEMPRLDEDLEQRKNYSLDSTWERIVVPLSGSLAAGSAELRIISGFDSTVGDRDDFECRDLVAELCGVGAPIVI
ncbi:MAG: hypothetical protein M3440_09440 [Chloroflexota bacterium]|nr:hypothetical protein [Chloroflexota bacterium]